MKRISLDTNLLVYAHDASVPAKRRCAQDALAAMRQPDLTPIISTQVLQEFYNSLTRKLGFTPVAAKKELLIIENIPVISMTTHLVMVAIDLNATASISFWDALIVAAAQSAQCDEIWTEDQQAGRLFGKLRVVNPFAGV